MLVASVRSIPYRHRHDKQRMQVVCFVCGLLCLACALQTLLALRLSCRVEAKLACLEAASYCQHPDDRKQSHMQPRSREPAECDEALISPYISA
jgi:hypothetical protein